MTLLFANREEVDILCREDLDRMALGDDRLKAIYCLSKPHDQWKGERGWINGDMIQRYMPKPSSS